MPAPAITSGWLYGGDERAVARCRRRERAGLRLVVIDAVGDNRDAVATEPIDLGTWGLARYVDGQASAEFAGDARQRHAMIAGRGRDDRGEGRLALSEGEQRVAGSAPLERSGALQCLELEPDVTTRGIGQAVGMDQRRASDVRRDTAGSRLDVSE